MACWFNIVRDYKIETILIVGLGSSDFDEIQVNLDGDRLRYKTAGANEWKVADKKSAPFPEYLKTIRENGIFIDSNSYSVFGKYDYLFFLDIKEGKIVSGFWGYTDHDIIKTGTFLVRNGK